MQLIPGDILTHYEAILKKRAVPASRHPRRLQEVAAVLSRFPQQIQPSRHLAEKPDTVSQQTARLLCFARNDTFYEVVIFGRSYSRQKNLYPEIPIDT